LPPLSGRFLRTADLGSFNPLLSHIRQVLAELKVGAFLRKLQQPFRLLSAELGFRSFHGAPRPTRQSKFYTKRMTGA
jgi:hypothetical protein